MPGQQTCAPPVIVTLPAQLDAAAAEQAADQITAAFTPGVSVVIADLTAAACCDRAAIQNLLRAHRQATVRTLQLDLVESGLVHRDRGAQAAIGVHGHRNHRLAL